MLEQKAAAEPAEVPEVPSGEVPWVESLWRIFIDFSIHFGNLL